MNWIVSLVGKWTGKVWEVMDGYKTKASGIALVLSGLSILITQVFGIQHDLASIWAFISALPNNSAWITLITGLGVLGIGHKMEKANPK